MATVTFDTLAYSNKLQESGVPRAQAEAMAQANAEAFKEMVVTQQLATKQDIDRLEGKIQDVKHDLLKGMVTGMLAQTALLVGIIAFLR